MARPLNRYDSLGDRPLGYNSNYQIVQTPGYLMIMSEMINEVCSIHMDGRPHLAQNGSLVPLYLHCRYVVWRTRVARSSVMPEPPFRERSGWDRVPARLAGG